MSLGPRVAQDMKDYFITKNYNAVVDTTDGNTIYQGWAKRTSLTSEPVWRIKRTIISGSDITTVWCDSNINFDNVWDNRLSLSYS